MKDRAWRCQYYQTGYTPDDATALAKYWGIGVSETKTRVEDKILWGNEKYLRDTVLKEARAAHPTEKGTPAVSTKQKNWKAFVDSKYDYCHAKMLVGSYFGSDTSEVKSLMGHKLAAG